MSSGKIENQILDAVEAIVDNAVAHAGFDRTIQAQVARCANESQGKYVIKYQDGLFYAYSSNIDTIYKKGDSVYILIPGNDMSETKTIIGLVSNLGAGYISTIEEEDKYETTGNDCVSSQVSVSLCSYIKEQEIDLYNEDAVPATKTGFTFDLEAFEFYLKKSSYFKGGAYFRTALPEEQRYSGDYGIAYELVFKDNATGAEKIITYKINIDDMEGDPYYLSVASKQYCIWEIDTENFVRLKRIYVFQNSFPNQKENKLDDIFITNIELMGANAIPTDEESNCSISIITKQGIYFDDNDTDTSSRLIETVIRAKGNVVQSNSSSLKYYWFKENNSVGYDSVLFQRYGGPGWECLNDYDVIAEGVREWHSGNSTFTIQKSNAPAKENGYKCVAIYNEKTILTKEFTIYNNSSTYDITISSSEGTQFYYDIGDTILKCLINNAEATGSDYSYSWSVVDNIGEFNKLSETSNQLAVAARTINNSSTYKCIVSYKNSIIGKATITLKNSLEGAYAYSAVIENGNQIFKYNENGISPASEAVENPITILPLDFTVYDDNGVEVPHEAIGNSNVEWWVPENGTMLNVLSSYGDPIRIENGYEVYTNTYNIGFDITKTYNINNTNNTIILKVVYKEKKLTTKTNFNFLKEGENGSNGSDFVCRLVPNVKDGEIAPKNVILTYDETETGSNYNLNYNRPTGQSNNWLNTELYHNGVNIFRGYQSGVSTEDDGGNQVIVQWSILKNKYDYVNGASIEDDSNLTIDADTGAITFNVTEYENPANIIKCTLTYNGVEYVAAMPIIISRVSNRAYNLSLKENSGFLTAMYTTDGQNPIYNNITPHELILKQNDEEITERENLSYDWTIKGQIYLSEWQSDLNLIMRNITSPHKIYFSTADTTYLSGKSYYKYDGQIYKQLILNVDYVVGGTMDAGIYEVRIINNMKYFKPADSFDGLCVSNGLYCSAKNNGIEIANIHIPIYMYLNRYGNAAINGWDGNTISLNDEAGVILSPQVGAGHKENDNSFTGVVIGSVKESGSKEIETGLFGYNHGQRTIKLDAEDGSAEFGKQGSGQIIINPESNSAILKSGNYSEAEGTGMQIDLSEPSIKYGSGNFTVDSTGHVTLSELTTIQSSSGGSTITIKDIEEASLALNVEASILSITVPTGADLVPLEDKKYTVILYPTFCGKEIQLNSIETQDKHAGITATSNIGSLDEKKSPTIIFSLSQGLAIESELCSYQYAFSYTREGKTYTAIKTFSISVSINTEVDYIDVTGERNYLLGTNDLKIIDSAEAASGTVRTGAFYSILDNSLKKWFADKIFTISADFSIVYEEGEDKSEGTYCFWSKDPLGSLGAVSWNISELTENPIRQSWTCSNYTSDSLDTNAIGIRTDGQTHGKLKVAHIKIEYGDVATDWREAYEDIDAFISYEYTLTDTYETPSTESYLWSSNYVLDSEKYAWRRAVSKGAESPVSFAAPKCFFMPSQILVSSETQYRIGESTEIEPEIEISKEFNSFNDFPTKAEDWKDLVDKWVRALDTNIIYLCVKKDDNNCEWKEDDGWNNNRPVWTKEYQDVKFLWTRTKYRYKNPTLINYSPAYHDTSWVDISEREKSTSAINQQIQQDMRGVVNIKDGAIEIFNNNIIDESTAKIVMNTSGISFSTKKMEEWVGGTVWGYNSNTEKWEFNADNINVLNLKADNIDSGILTLKGTDLTILGSVADIDNLPSSGMKDGDCYYVESESIPYSYNGSAWIPRPGGEFLLTDKDNKAVCSMDINGVTCYGEDGCSVFIKTIADDATATCGLHLYDKNNNLIAYMDSTNGQWVVTKQKIVNEIQFGDAIKIITTSTGINFVAIVTN